MTYRMYIKHLTEKTINEPLNSEIMLNTSSGNIVIESKDGIVSPTKDIFNEISYQRFLNTLLSNLLDKISKQVDELKKQYENENSRITAVEVRIKKLEDLMTEIEGKLKEIRQIVIDVADILIYYYDLMVKGLPEYIKMYLECVEIMRPIEHAEYVYSTLNTLKLQCGKELVRVKNKYTSVKNYVDTMVYKSTYDAWVKDYVNRTLALKNKYSQITSIKFKHSGSS